mgnify:CR=1 FL=1
MPSTATPLTAEQTQQLRTQLLQRQEQLLQELDEVKRATLAQIPNQGDAGHPDDRKEHTEGMFFNRVRDAEAARDGGARARPGQEAKAQPQHDIPRHDGQGPHKGVTNRFHFSFPL